MSGSDVITTSALHRNMARVLARVAAGEEVGVTNWGALVAWLVPPDTADGDELDEDPRADVTVAGVRWIPVEEIDPWDYPAAPIPGAAVVVASIVNDDDRSPVGLIEQPDAEGVTIRFPGPVAGVMTAHATYGELRRPPS